MTDQPAGKPARDKIKINRNNNNVHCPQYKGVNTRTIVIKISKNKYFEKKNLSIFSTNAARNTTQAKKKKSYRFCTR